MKLLVFILLVVLVGCENRRTSHIPKPPEPPPRLLVRTIEVDNSLWGKEGTATCFQWVDHQEGDSHFQRLEYSPAACPAPDALGPREAVTFVFDIEGDPNGNTWNVLYQKQHVARLDRLDKDIPGPSVLLSAFCQRGLRAYTQTLHCHLEAPDNKIEEVVLFNKGTYEHVLSEEFPNGDFERPCSKLMPVFTTSGVRQPSSSPPAPEHFYKVVWHFQRVNDWRNLEKDGDFTMTSEIYYDQNCEKLQRSLLTKGTFGLGKKSGTNSEIGIDLHFDPMASVVVSEHADLDALNTTKYLNYSKWAPGLRVGFPLKFTHDFPMAPPQTRFVSWEKGGPLLCLGQMFIPDHFFPPFPNRAYWLDHRCLEPIPEAESTPPR